MSEKVPARTVIDDEVVGDGCRRAGMKECRVEVRPKVEAREDRLVESDIVVAVDEVGNSVGIGGFQADVEQEVVIAGTAKQRSFPSPPMISSIPSRPRIRSLPANPLSPSPPFEPTIVSLPGRPRRRSPDPECSSVDLRRHPAKEPPVGKRGAGIARLPPRRSPWRCPLPCRRRSDARNRLCWRRPRYRR